MRIANLKDELKGALPTLHVHEESGTTFIRGTLPVIGSDGSELNSYQIELELSNDHPKSPPIVRETGGKIPWTLDRHNPQGRACLFVPEQQSQFWNERTSLVDFLKFGAAGQFFYSQTYYEETGKWPFGERPHGFAGILDYYYEQIKTKEPDILLRFLDILAAEEIKLSQPCYCGKSRSLLYCHVGQVVNLRKQIPQWRVKYALSRATDLAREAGWKPTHERNLVWIHAAIGLPIGSYQWNKRWKLK